MGTDNTPNAELKEKQKKLNCHLKSLGSLAVGFSGGVDSSFLLASAHEVLGDSVIAITAAAPFIPKRELLEAKAFCKERGIRQLIITADLLKEETFRQNPPDRCYFCKRRIFSEIMRAAGENGIKYVAEGSNTDDLSDYRPGLKAILELSVISPLKEAGLSKGDIRLLSREMNLPTWNKPAYACLASRFVYGEEITKEKLQMVEQAEQFLIGLGFLEERVRMHGNIARIEVPAKDISLLASDKIRGAVYERFKEIGFSFVTLDLKGYRTGSMNETIPGHLPVFRYT